MARQYAYVSVMPGMQSGQPCLNMRRVTVATVSANVWAGNPLRYIMEGWELRRADVLVACWYESRYGTPKWRKRWGAWRDQYEGLLWNGKFREVPLPPTEKDTPDKQEA